jgi:hypothetical protein
MHALNQAPQCRHRLRLAGVRSALLALAVFLSAGLNAGAQSVVQFNQSLVTYNLQSQRGVPISSSVNTNIGSDGRMPTVVQPSGASTVPTTNQFRGFVSFGANPGLALTNWLAVSNSVVLENGTVTNFSAQAVLMQRPLAVSNSTVVMVLRRAIVGAPYLSRQVSFPFGSVIEPPDTDENGSNLVGIANTVYWQAKPYTNYNPNTAGFYYSPHSRKVYAIQPGPIFITWQAAFPLPSAPTSGVAGVDYIISGGGYFRLYTVDYVVSSVPVKSPQKIYWTEGVYRGLGKPVIVPVARVRDVNVVYNSSFPQYVAQEPANDPDSGVNTNTLWYSTISGSINAYNKEGRVFVELLGDTTGEQDGNIDRREQLGYEIVDVLKNPTALDVTIELGDKLTPPDANLISVLTPEPILSGTKTFTYPPFTPETETGSLYATVETENENDYQVHWMIEGEVGLKWPYQLARYRLIWPPDISRYMHYVRPLVATDAEARQTAVPLPTANAPVLESQDDFGLLLGGFITGEFAYYSRLDIDHPAHRALIRLNSGNSIEFIRVFSWLDETLLAMSVAGTNIPAELTAGGFSGSVATNLSSYTTNSTFIWNDSLTIPRVVRENVEVGQRLFPPDGEPTIFNSSLYPAGYIRQEAGTLFNDNAYLNPFEVGLDAAAYGSIIPVNAIPGSNELEVLWFRPHNADTSKGFTNTYWPSAIGYYTIGWPTNSREIVLASKKGSEGDGPLTSLEAAGNIYYQNDRTLPGYNPNEEHAIMSGGTVFATRDDLNITNGVDYSSEPFVLLEYLDAGSRPAMSAFRVLREKPSAGWVFDYITEAGQLLQAPMPLSLLGKPVEGSGASAVNYNIEPTDSSGDLPGNWISHGGTNSLFSHYGTFTYRDRKNDFWVYRGLHAGLPELQVGRYDAVANTFTSITGLTAIVGSNFSMTVHSSRQDEYVSLASSNLPAWLDITGLTVSGTPLIGDTGTSVVQLVSSYLYETATVTSTVSITVSTNGASVGQGPLVITSTNAFTGAITVFSNRPPFLALSPNASNSFAMQYYYKTAEGFAFPGMSNPPPVGSIVPYLRPIDSTNGTFIGDGADKNTDALSIVYRPVWPTRDGADPLPTMAYGLTLTLPQLGLPGIRDWKTARVLYQQSVATDLSTARDSVVLHDPTREKIVPMNDPALLSTGITLGGMSGRIYPVDLIDDIRTEVSQGKTYFPDLPPHLVNRIHYDPLRGADGSLVLIGEFNKEIFGEDYLQLNVLTGSDLATVENLYPAGNAAKATMWSLTVRKLAASVETYGENPESPGVYIPLTETNIFVQDLVEISNDETPVDSYALSATGPGAGYVTLIEAGGSAFTDPGDPVALHIVKVGGSIHSGEVKVLPAANPLSELVTFQHTPDLAARFNEYEYEWKIAAPVDGLPPATDPSMSLYQSLVNGTNLPRYILGGSGIQVLGDNYLTVRYRPVNTNHPLYNQWSSFTTPQLAEGWIKRVLAGINPFNQRTTDLFNNSVNTDASLLTQAGTRWEGDIALNIDTIDNYGLIEIYETVLRRGRSLSIGAGYNYGPANDALLLAAGYLNDLYMILGNEAWADAANPTIGIGTADNTYGDIATALFAFKGQVASLLEEELALIRGRDDFLLPGVSTAPVYNRLVWNYTRGIDAGEVIYALNYNIQENPNGTPDGSVDAADAARMFPQGQGDAYGHYLTAVKGYYSLFMDTDFDWVPRAEAVTVLGQPVSVDYQDERKFAAAAVALGRAGQQTFDLTWRKDYQPGHEEGWSHFSGTRVNTQRPIPSTRYWGLDHWASRVGQANYINWIAANAILPDEDPNPNHEGIQKIDRTTVPELMELASMGSDIQAAMDNAEGGLTPLGIPEGSIALDINPNQVVGTENGTHFEQIYTRAKVALNNAVAAFDDAKDVTRLMRSEQDSLADFQASVARQELAYENALIEYYGTPYTDDIGPGGTYDTGFEGPDLFHYVYTDTPMLTYPGLLTNTQPKTFRIDIQDFDGSYRFSTNKNFFNFIEQSLTFNGNYVSNREYISFTLDSSGAFTKPSEWTGQRASPGKLQEAISRIQLARNAALAELEGQEALKRKLDRHIEYFESKVAVDTLLNSNAVEAAIIQTSLEGAVFVGKTIKLALDIWKGGLEKAAQTALEAIPKSAIVGTAVGGDTFSAARAAILASYGLTVAAKDVGYFVQETALGAVKVGREGYLRLRNVTFIQPLLNNLTHKKEVLELDQELVNVQLTLFRINQRLQELDDAVNAYRALAAKGERLQAEREVYRKRAAAVVQGYRTRDAAFRIFRNEKLERYKTMFDLAARYSFLAANAYDYETGLLDSPEGRAFMNRIISARALGVVQNGEPQFAGSETGDPGLSSALAEMKADWDVVRNRLGFNNPDAYGTTASLRTENFRISPDTNDVNAQVAWKDLLYANRHRDVLEDDDVRRHCLQINRGSGLPVPGIIIEFSTTIANGENMFGLQLGPGDHAFNPSAFATKIFGVGVALEGYRGMDEPAANSGNGGTSPTDPNTWYLDPLALSATPYVYLVPVGEDYMRSPPLGDAGDVRGFDVADVAIPLPFNIGASDFAANGLYLTADSLSEDLYTIRKHQSFRPVPSTSFFQTSLYGNGGTLLRSQYMNNRLIGRSAWNSRWKLVIPGHTLLNDPDEGLERFINTVRDIEINFITYSYSGN